MAISSYPDLGWDLWKRCGQKNMSIKEQLSMIERSLENNLEKSILEKYAQYYNARDLAFFFYPGSYFFLFISMVFIGFIGFSIEYLTLLSSGNNLILTSLISQVVAYRYVHFGYVPGQSYLLFGSIILNLLIFYLLNLLLERLYSNK